MIAPRPNALRLSTRAVGSKPPMPPFGLRAWADDAGAVAVWLDATTSDMRDVRAVAAQIPDALAFAERSLVVVLSLATRRVSAWRRVIGSGRVPVPRAVRCAALLVRGYVDISSGPVVGEPDLVWGWAEPRDARRLS